MDLSRSDWEYVTERAGAFVGREWVFARVRSFLSGPPGTLLLRGAPGSGKTALAARLAQASCGRLSASDSPPPIEEGVISAGVFCRSGRATVAEFAQRLSDQLAASVDGFADVLRAAIGPRNTFGNISLVIQGDVHEGATVSGVMLPRQDGRLAFSAGVAVPLRQLREQGRAEPIVLLVDAVDEAADVDGVNTFSRLLGRLDGVYLIVTCRPDPVVVSNFRSAAHKQDLIADAPADNDDVRRYVRNRLTGQSHEKTVDVLADRISSQADGNFLYAFYVTGALIGYGSLDKMDDKTARALSLPVGGLAGVYEDFLDRQVAGDRKRWAAELRPVLAPLCVAVEDGFTIEQLATIASCLTGRSFTSTMTRDVTRDVGQLIDGPHPDGPFRIYHQSFSRFLADHRHNSNWPIDLAETNSAVVRALAPSSGQSGTKDWAKASAYVRRHLAAHAATAGVLDNLLLDSGYLLYADLPRLMEVADNASSPSARHRAQLVRLTPEAIDGSPTDRAAMFSVTEVLEGLGSTYSAGNWTSSYQARWATAPPRKEHVSLKGHQGPVRAVCTVTVNDRELLASGSEDRTVRLWDPRTGTQTATFEGHRRLVTTLCTVTVDGRELLASGSEDGTVRLWDPHAGTQTATLEVHEGWVIAMCAVNVNDRELLAINTSHGPVRLWDPRAGTRTSVLEGTEGWVRSVCPVTVGVRELLATAYDDGTVRLWDPCTSAQTAELKGHQDKVILLCTVTMSGRKLLASGSLDGTTRLWDPRTGTATAILEVDSQWATAACAVNVDGRELLATSGRIDATVRLWDPNTGAQTTILNPRSDGVMAMCSVTVDGQELLATGSHDRTVRLWGLNARTKDAAFDGYGGWVTALCAATVEDREHLATGYGDGTVQLRDLSTGEQTAIFEAHEDWVLGMCTVTVDGQERLATSGHDERVRLWDLSTGAQTAIFETRQGPADVLCAVSAESRELLAIRGAYEQTVRLWDPRTGTQAATLETANLSVTALCAVTFDGRELLASGSTDETVRLWDPRTGAQTVATGPGAGIFERRQGSVTALCAVTIDGRELLASGRIDGTVRLWDPHIGSQVIFPDAHKAQINALCTVTVHGRELLASGSDDETVRLWDPRTGIVVSSMPVHHPVSALAPVANALAIGFKSGILVIKTGKVS